MNKLLEIKNLSLTRNDYCIFSNINLDVQEGQLINIYGKNGSGKTSLLKILAGITERTGGEMIYHNSFDKSLKRTYVGHKYGVKNNLTAVTSAWVNLKSSESFLNSVKTQVKAAEIANEGIAAEYQSGVGSRSTLDVIQSNALLLDAQISLANSERNYLLAQYSLLKSVGLLNSSYLNLR